jgi:hypothetical protein
MPAAPRPQQIDGGPAVFVIPGNSKPRWSLDDLGPKCPLKQQELNAFPPDLTA